MKVIMDIKAKKLELVQLILDTNKTSILEKVEAILKKQSSPDWWDDLGEKEKKEIERGISEADNGKLIPHKEVMNKAKAKYKLE